MLIIPQDNEAVILKSTLQKEVKASKLKAKCCRKYKKNNRCRRCPCYDLLQKAS